MGSAKQPQAGVRAGSEFFTEPDGVTQRRYEALRAYFVDGATAAQAGGTVRVYDRHDAGDGA